MKNCIVFVVFMLVLLQVVVVDVEVKDVWVCVIVLGQKVSGVFMSVISVKGVILFGVSSLVVKMVEIYEMKMEGDVMKMCVVYRIELLVGKMVNLIGDYYIMFIDLNKELKVGDKVFLMFKVEQKGKQEKVKVEVEVCVFDVIKFGDDYQYYY